MEIGPNTTLLFEQLIQCVIFGFAFVIVLLTAILCFLVIKK